MNRVDAAKQIIDLAQTYLPAIIAGVRELVGPQLTADERRQVEAHIADYERMAAEQRRKAEAASGENHQD